MLDNVNTLAKEYFNAKEQRAWSKALPEALESTGSATPGFLAVLERKLRESIRDYRTNRDVRRRRGLEWKTLGKSSARVMILSCLQLTSVGRSPGDALSRKPVLRDFGHGKRMLNA